MNPINRSGWGGGWLAQLDKARIERNRVNRLNSLRRGNTKPLPKYLQAPNPG